MSGFSFCLILNMVVHKIALLKEYANFLLKICESPPPSSVRSPFDKTILFPPFFIPKELMQPLRELQLKLLLIELWNA
jgi:hypothetical protein